MNPKEWRESVLKDEGLQDWTIEFSNSGGYCWFNQKKIQLNDTADTPPNHSAIWFLHEVAHALHPWPEGEQNNHYHGGRWAFKFAELIEKYMTRKKVPTTEDERIEREKRVVKVGQRIALYEHDCNMCRRQMREPLIDQEHSVMCGMHARLYIKDLEEAT